MLTSFVLHIMAMLFMLMDHLWGVGLVNSNILTCIGRLAFPIFAFMIVEGYFYTSNIKKYISRIFTFALISEIPFNLMITRSPYYIFHQNVLWTFLLAILLIHLNEKVKSKSKIIRAIILILTLILALILGTISFCDYGYPGILMLLTFYLFRKKTWYNLIFQIICLGYINFHLIGGLEYVFTILEREIHFTQQGLALLSLIPIWLYNGKQGYYNKYIKYFYYFFYPIHMLILAIIKIIL